MSLGWVYPVIAFAPNTKSIPDWRDNYVFATLIPPKKTIEDLIRLKAKKAGLDADLMARVAYCESGFQHKWNYLNSTGDPNSKWSAFGVFQIIKGHEIKYGIDRMTLEGNIDLAFKLYIVDGINPWILSKKCILSVSQVNPKML